MNGTDDTSYDTGQTDDTQSGHQSLNSGEMWTARVGIVEETPDSNGDDSYDKDIEKHTYCVNLNDSAFARTLGELLADGHSVHVNEIGTFQPRVSGKVAREQRGLVARDVHISGVQFTPDPEFLLQLKQSTPTPSHTSRPLPSDAEVSRFLTRHFAAHDRLMRKNVITHFHVTKDQALRLLRQQVTQGRLQRCGNRATAYYIFRTS